jgi:predicted RNase H-like HicB family nuclease
MVCQKQSNGSYFALCPDLKGCYTQGDTYEEAISNLKEIVYSTIKEEMAENTEILNSKEYIYSDLFIDMG